MGRLLALCLIVLGIWAASEIYTKGLDNAFGGLLGSSRTVQDAETASRRAANAFQRAYDSSEVRADRALARPDE